jgi:DNA-binding transcriptional MocR family regulator
VDEALPTTAALAEHYGVSQATITRVLRARAAEGLVSTVPRWGRCQLLEVGFDEIRLLVSRPPRTAGNAQRMRPGTWCSVKASRVSWTSPPA